VADASGAHLSFQWSQAGSVPQTPRLPYQYQYYLPPDTGERVPALYCIWEEGQTSAYCRNLLGSETGTNLYCSP